MTDPTQDNLALAALEMSEEIAPELTQLTAQQLDEKLQELRDLDDKYKEASKIAEDIQKDLASKKASFLNILDALERTSYLLPGVGRVTKVTERRYKLPESPADKEKVFKYIAEQYGKEALYDYATINHQRINSFVAEEMEQGKEVPGIPAHTVNTYIKFGRK